MRSLALTLALTAVLASTVAALQHENHAMGASGESIAWRHPPMDPSMPMLPGLETAVPVVAPFLAGMGIDPETLPMAEPSRIIAVQDGDTVAMEASIVRRMINGRMFVMYGYNGQYPGPLFKAAKDATFMVRFTNRIQMPTTVHWHGLRLDNPFDGVPGVTQKAVEDGETFLYELKVPDAGIYWYHPHVREDVQQDLGLYGNLLIASPEADYYGPANREEMLVLDDLLLDDNGMIPWGDEAATHALMGRFGTVMLVNGETDRTLEVARGEVVRFFMTNVANSRTFNTVFGGGTVKLVASDVSRFERETWVSSVPIAPAERYVVDVLFDEPGEFAITNSIQAINHFRGEFYPQVDTLVSVTVTDVPAAPDHREAFRQLRDHASEIAEVDALRGHLEREPDHVLELGVRVRNLPQPIVLSMQIDTLYVPPMEWNDAMPMMNWLASAEQVTWVLEDRATGKENMDIDWNFEVGDVVKIRVFNNPKTFHPMNHPIHVHGQRYLVLSMDGVPNPNMVWKDTAIVPVGSTVDFLVEMSNPGTWMLHCHIAEHLEAGMMLGFEVEEGGA